MSNILRSVSHLLAAAFNHRSEFERLWNEPVSASERAAGFPGRWQGEWRSEANGHHGVLRCLLSGSGPAQLDAKFHATYARCLRVAYPVLLHAEQTPGRLLLKGEADLGTLAGGIYEYDGELKADLFECTYRCKYDHGIFRLKPWTSG